MHRFVAALLLAGGSLAGCSLQPDPPPPIPPSAYGGMGDRMGQCLQYASESACLKQTWGGDDFGN